MSAPRRALMVALLGASACSKHGGGTSAPDGAASAGPALARSTVDSGDSGAAVEPAEPLASPIATVKLLDRGKTPRRKLRYTWRAGGREQLVMDLLTTVSAQAEDASQPEIPLPGVHVVVGIEPRTVAPDGEMQYAWHVESTTVPASDPRVPREVADGLRAEVSTIEHLSGRATVTAQGLAKEVVVDPESISGGGGTGQMIEQMRQQLRDLAAPLPVEEVGVGAKWQKLSLLVAKDAKLNQSETFTLEELAGTRGALDDILTQTAPAQPLRGPASPQVAQKRIDSMLMSGDAKTRFDLSRLVPQTTLDGTTTMIVSDPATGDNGSRVTMTMRMGIILSGSSR